MVGLEVETEQSQRDRKLSKMSERRKTAWQMGKDRGRRDAAGLTDKSGRGGRRNGLERESEAAERRNWPSVSLGCKFTVDT